MIDDQLHLRPTVIADEKLYRIADEAEKGVLVTTDWKIAQPVNPIANPAPTLS